MDTVDPADLADVASRARAALLEQVGEDVVGEHLAEVPDSDHVLTHYFDCTQPGYRGWRWAVSVVALGGEGGTRVTIDEIVLLPGDDAIVAPAWVPWRERIRPGDLSPGDILPTEEDDLRLVPGYFAGDLEPGIDERQARAVADEVGLGRSRVLSPYGRDQAAERWYDGEHGPNVPLAQSAPGRCGNCGFLVRLAGPLAEMFGVCANERANDDGAVVSLDHGCGAHSQAQLRRKQLPQPLPDPVFDTLTAEDLEEF